ncbi:hypothetical protein [Halogranum gelatinilyticum]|uniref:hypothetical protein n=1 Tax=Halogranum gelatinilyticum TaxID=660521 RepID=UPI00147C1967|nr:hypothetical protein [Halogranum gelatinilyticum]
MPSRRAFMSSISLGSIAGLAGCSAFDETPDQGSIRLVNDQVVPHEISLQVVDVGSRQGNAPGEVAGSVNVVAAQRNLSLTVVLPPGETKTYSDVFTEPVWYAIQFEMDDNEPVRADPRMAYNPSNSVGDCNSGSFVEVSVSDDGNFWWEVVGIGDNGLCHSY